MFWVVGFIVCMIFSVWARNKEQVEAHRNEK